MHPRWGLFSPLPAPPSSPPCRRANDAGDLEHTNSTADSRVSSDSYSGSDQSFSVRDLYSIRYIASRPALFRRLVHSMCPAIHGHSIVKGARLVAPPPFPALLLWALC